MANRIKLTKPQHDYLRKRLMRQGRIVSQRLANHMAGEDVELGDMKLSGEDDGLSKKDRLRKYLDLVIERREALDDPEADFGACVKCGALLSYAEVEQMPWATTCRRCP